MQFAATSVVAGKDPLLRAFRDARRTGTLALAARHLDCVPVQVFHLEDHLEKDEKKWECVDLVKCDLSLNAITELSQEIALIKTLTSLRLTQNQLKSLPNELFELQGLVLLDVASNRLCGEMNPRIGQLVRLRELVLAGNQLNNLPDSLCDCTQLETLRIEENALTQLPSGIGALHKLTSLIAHTNAFTCLPESIGKLTLLTVLDLKKNKLTSLRGISLKALLQLKFLDLRQNKLTDLPVFPASTAIDTTLAANKSSCVLDQLSLGFNCLETIDDKSSLWGLFQTLTVLDLRDNKLTRLPEVIGLFKQLKTLDVSNNDLSELPVSLGYLRQLNHLVLDGNPLRSIRRAVINEGCEALKKYLRTRGPPFNEQEHAAASAQEEDDSNANTSATSHRLEHLYRDAISSSATLDLSGQKLSVLPSFPLKFNCQTMLLHLHLNRNKLSSLPKEIADCVALQSLQAEENALVQIDPAISRLPNLRILRLRKNQLTSQVVETLFAVSSSRDTSASPAWRSLSVSFSPHGLPVMCTSSWKKIKCNVHQELDLRNNQLTTLPVSLCHCRALETLNVSFNQIETVAGFPFRDLQAMRTLSLTDNKLTALGMVYEMPLLKSLSVENNSLTSIPYELALCRHLQLVYLNGNPQKTVRPAVLAKGSSEVLLYLKNKLPSHLHQLADQAPAQAILKRDHLAHSSPSPPPCSLGRQSLADEAASRNTGRVCGVQPASISTQLTKKPANRIGFAADGDASLDEPMASRPSTGSSREQTAKSRSTEVPSSPSTPPGSIRREECVETKETKDSSSHELTGKIASLEVALENPSLSAAKQYALKKELAMARSQRTRLLRNAT